jgi:hypothetical protein
MYTPEIRKIKKGRRVNPSATPSAKEIDISIIIHVLYSLK